MVTTILFVSEDINDSTNTRSLKNQKQTLNFVSKLLSYFFESYLSSGFSWLRNSVSLMMSYVVSKHGVTHSSEKLEQYLNLTTRIRQPYRNFESWFTHQKSIILSVLIDALCYMRSISVLKPGKMGLFRLESPLFE